MYRGFGRRKAFRAMLNLKIGDGKIMASNFGITALKLLRFQFETGCNLDNTLA